MNSLNNFEEEHNEEHDINNVYDYRPSNLQNFRTARNVKSRNFAKHTNIDLTKKIDDIIYKDVNCIFVNSNLTRVEI